MSQNQQSYTVGRNKGGGSVKRAREMLNAGARAQNQNDRGMPPPLRPRPTHSRSSSQDAEIEIGYEFEDDPRGPVPIMPIQGLQIPRHSGPPPSSRRGPSSVYSRLIGTAVSPIPEESVRQTRKNTESFASSTVIPSSWGSGPPTPDVLGSNGSEQEEPKPEPKPEPKRNKRDSLTILRQASLGKRGKPSLLSISKPQEQPPTKNNKSSDSKVNGLQPRASLDSIASDTDSVDLEKEKIEIENEKKAQSIGIGLGLGRPGAGMSSRKPDSHRPPELDLNAVRSAEAHGSLTSLPDLIRRATQVASNLEHGRTASRLGILDMFDFGNGGKRSRASQNRSSTTMSVILASFPPPRTDTPDDSVRTSWPSAPTNGVEKSRLREMQRNSVDESQDETKPRRRCCGMSMRTFIYVCIVVLCTIAAAVVIPIILVVLPRNNQPTESAAAVNTTMASTCEQKLPCMNGGVSVQSGSTCSCVCVNGFSGTQCATVSDGSCTTTKTLQSGNATIGSSLPNLFTQSETDFNIPLNETEILSLFNANNVSCTVQNALVAFAGLSPSKLRRRHGSVEIQDLESEPLVPTVPIIKRATTTQAPNAPYVPPILSVPTSTAVLEAAGAMQTAATSTTKPASVTSASASASTSAPSVNGTAARVYEFARVAVLFIFERTQDLSVTSTAQRQIDLYLLSEDVSSDPNMKMSMTKPVSFVLDFTHFTITLSDGTVVGGNGTAI
ncbi:hypothetical protein EYB26_008946 [Talaromyces marneffei]|uniref:Cadherin-related tumor suppressor n=1 Tax=Talaromyces marneffei PM1 TaxID=1077442 RepID=A0A093VBJ0_TALMA|nr:uncharacterized protein EYB26_008946 [Talaromyces marneffei]QGA21236.1 hypothetical protein EYB26_008946 [Talaromyces marneffei]